MIKPIVSDKTSKHEAVIIPVPYEATASGEKGAAKGPEAVINVLTYQLEDYDRILESITFEKVKITPLEELKVRDLKPEEMVEAVKKEVDKLKKTDKFPIILGGEHSVSIGAIKSLKEEHKDLTVVQIDAHLDLRDSDSDYNIDNPSSFAHSCVMRRARDFGCSTVQVGIRMIHSGELEYAKKEKILDTIFQCPVKATPEEIIKKIKSKNVYLTIDVDGLDPSQMPGTGTPVQGGLGWYPTIDIIRKVFEKKNVVGADIVEVSPLPGSALTERGAAQLLYHIVGFKYDKVLR